MSCRGRAKWFVAVLIGLALIASACGGSSDSGDGGSGSDPGPADAGIDPNGTLTAGYDLVAEAAGGFTLDPTKMANAAADDGLFYLLYGRLLAPESDGSLVPALAEKTTIVDPNTIEVVLRGGSTFQDGTPFDASAVKGGLERSLAANNRSAYGERFFDLQGVTVVDPLTIRLTIANGAAASWHDQFLGSWQTTIVAPDADFSRPVGAGPMRLVSYVPQENMELARWDGYWNPDEVKVGVLELIQVAPTAPEAGIAALKSGQLDFVGSTIEQVEALSGDLEPLLTPDSSRVYNLPLCKRDGPLSDRRVRLALNKAIDRQAISDAIFGGNFGTADQLWPSGDRFYQPELADTFAYDPEGASDLLAQAGYPDGFTFDVYVLPTASMPDVVSIIQQQYADIGVTINIVPTPNYVNDFLQPQKAGAGATSAIQAGPARLSSWNGTGIGNTCNYNDPELAAIQAELFKVSSGSDEARSLWAKANEIFVNDALSVFILFGSNIAAYDSATVGDPARWPVPPLTLPDVRQTYARSGS